MEPNGLNARPIYRNVWASRKGGDVGHRVGSQLKTVQNGHAGPAFPVVFEPGPTAANSPHFEYTVDSLKPISGS